MAYTAQIVAMQRILQPSLYITGRLKNLTLDAAHLAVANGHVHANAAHVNCLNSFFGPTQHAMLLDPTQMHDAMPLPIVLLAC